MVAFTRVSKISDRMLLSRPMYVGYFTSQWGFKPEQAVEAWERDFANPNVAREQEDGITKLYVLSERFGVQEVPASPLTLG